MARPAKSIDVQTSHNTKDVVQKRKAIEGELKGNKRPTPTTKLTKSQKKIFKEIVGFLEEYAGKPDSYVITGAAITVDRLRDIDEQINVNSELLFDKDVNTVRKAYTTEFFRYCNELCLSPQARAKIGSLATARNKDEEDPLLKVLNDSG